MTRAPFVLGAIAIAACSSGAAPTTVPSSFPHVAFDVAASIDPSQERYVCELVQMPSDQGDPYVRGAAWRATAGIHHFLLFRTSFDPASPPPDLNQPIDCFEGDGVMKYERGYVAGGQKTGDDGFAFLDGQALPFRAGEVLLIQMHLLDAGDAPLSPSLHLELDLLEGTDVVEKVGTFRFYDPYIVVPPHASATARMRCPLHHDVTLLGAGSHMHERGVAYRAFADRAGQAPSSAPFFATSDWQSPPLWYGPMSLPAGSAIRFECDYQNPDDATYVQGLSADTNEMCMFSAFYVPAQDESEEQCADMDSLGTGTRSCAQTTSCLELCSPSDEPHFASGDPTVGACWQECIVDSCPNAAAALLPQLECTQAQCATECAQFGATCSQCVQDKCKAQLDACQALACGQ